MPNVYLAALGGGLALGAHPFDQSFNTRLRSHYDVVNAAFAPGKYLGDTPEQVALSIGAEVWTFRPARVPGGVALMASRTY